MTISELVAELQLQQLKGHGDDELLIVVNDDFDDIHRPLSLVASGKAGEFILLTQPLSTD